jgi:hypothetical protein
VLVRYACAFCNELIGLVEDGSHNQKLIKDSSTWQHYILCGECLEMSNEEKLLFLEEIEQRFIEYLGAAANAALNWSEQSFVDSFGINKTFYYEIQSKDIKKELQKIEQIKSLLIYK